MYRLLLVVAIVAGFLIAGPPSSTQAEDLVEVTVRITRVIELEDMDGFGGGEADFFAEVQIGAGNEFQRSGVIDDDGDISPDWRFTRTVDRDNPIPIAIRIFDYDSGFGFGSDWADISPLDNDVELNLIFDGHTGTWIGDVTGNVAEGDGDHGFPAANDGRKARIHFEIFVGTNPDADGDGIPDSIEINGVRDLSGNVVLSAAEMNPCRKTIIVWTDFMVDTGGDGHDHRMKADAVTLVVDAFDAAPLPAVTPCPYAGHSTNTGVDLVYLEGQPIAHLAVMGFDANYRAAKAANFPPELRPYAHYAIMVHDQAVGTTSSGLCCDSDGDYKDFLVSLGSWRATCVGPGANGTIDSTLGNDDVVVGGAVDVGADLTCDTTATGDDDQILAVGTGAADARVGTVMDQAGTFMHELGHSLGLGHGGDSGTNRKPQYLSVMNYNYQFGLLRGTIPPGLTQPPAVLDYSRSVLPTLTETDLDEAAGGGQAADEWVRWVDSAGTIRWSRPAADGSIDWTWDTPRTIDTDPVSVNLNADAEAGADETVLTGFDDWSNIKFRAIDAHPGGGAAWISPIPELTFQRVLADEKALLKALPGTVVIRKELLPNNAPGTFNLEIDGAIAGTGEAVGHNGTTGIVQLQQAGEITVSESAAGTTQLYHYETTIVCTDENDIVIAEGDGTSLTFDPGTGQAVNCVITNRLPIPEACLTKTYTTFILGTPDDDELIGTNGPDIIIGYGGNDRIDGRQGDDCIAGGDGNDTLIGGLGDDIIAGDDGNDNIDGGNGDDLLYGGDGNDTINGGNGNDEIYGGEGNDTINGGNQDDIIHGGPGNDTINGGAGNDLIYGNDGIDNINGSSGIDRCSAGNGGSVPGETVTLCEQIAPLLPP